MTSTIWQGLLTCLLLGVIAAGALMRGSATAGPRAAHWVGSVAASDALDYNFRPYRITQELPLCVDPGGGPEVEHPLLDVVARALAAWERSAGPPLPLTPPTCA